MNRAATVSGVSYAYVRVSTQDQAEHGAGIEIQRAAIEGLCEVRKVFTDEGLSGSGDLGVRVGLSEALGALERSDELVVYRLDRLARDLVLQETLLRKVWDKGATIRSCQPSETDVLVDDPSDPTRRLIRQILGAVNEYERAVIRMRMRAGRAAKKAKGLPHGGPPPYGLKVVHDEYVPDMYEQRTLAFMRELRAAGHSYGRMAEILRDKSYITRHGNPWSTGSVHRIMRNEQAKR